MQIDEGDIVGNCPDCGYIPATDIEYLFPLPCRCLQCGSTVEVAVNDKQRRVDL